MDIEKGIKFSKNFSDDYPDIAFHATTSRLSDKIEKNGFIAYKFFTDEEHEHILSVAKSLRIVGVDFGNYAIWRDTKSVTFAVNEKDALDHIKSNPCGQGLSVLKNVLQEIKSTGNCQQKTMAKKFMDKIESIQNANHVIYAVDLSNIKERLKHDYLYHVYSPVSPENIVARLDVISA